MEKIFAIDAKELDTLKNLTTVEIFNIIHPYLNDEQHQNIEYILYIVDNYSYKRFDGIINHKNQKYMLMYFWGSNKGDDEIWIKNCNGLEFDFRDELKNNMIFLNLKNHIRKEKLKKLKLRI